MSTTTTATECTDCRYTSGHTSWCRKGTGAPLVTAAERAAIDGAIAVRDVALRPARRVNLHTASSERIAREVIGSAIRLTVWAGWNEPRLRMVGYVERVENGRTVVRFTDGTWSYGPFGRVTVR